MLQILNSLIIKQLRDKAHQKGDSKKRDCRERQSLFVKRLFNY